MESSSIQELSFRPTDLHVTVERVHTVLPASPLPESRKTALYLSNLDDMVGSRVFTPTLYIYESGRWDTCRGSAADRLRAALSEVLVPYYPLSGRLRPTPGGKLEVVFTEGEGAVLAEARSEIPLLGLGDMSVPNPAWLPLLFRFPEEGPYQVDRLPPVIAQVTRFRCGGFSLGLRLCHCICDGLGAMQFLKAWSGTARSGRLEAVPPPCWERERLRPRNPPQVSRSHVEFSKLEDKTTLTSSIRRSTSSAVQKCYRITTDFRSSLKTLANAGEGVADDTPCSGFDALAAHLWRSWVKALDVKPLDEKLRLTFSVDARRKLTSRPLKDGFYGNIVCVACAVSSVGDLLRGGLSKTAELVRDARLRVTEEYLRSTIDYMEVERPTELEFDGKLTITQWTRFSIYESADFGWGRPLYAGPIDLTPTPQVCVLLPEKDSDVTRTVVAFICLPESTATRFRELLAHPT